MQLASFARGIDAAVIINAVGQIRVLLHFANDHARANSMLRARGDEVSLTRGNWIAQEELLHGSLDDGIQEPLASDSTPEAEQQFRVRFGSDDMPHFRLPTAASGPFKLRGKRVVGMDLNGQPVVRKEKFHEHGKFRVRGETKAARIRRV